MSVIVSAHMLCHGLTHMSAYKMLSKECVWLVMNTFAYFVCEVCNRHKWACITTSALHLIQLLTGLEVKKYSKCVVNNEKLCMNKYKHTV